MTVTTTYALPIPGVTVTIDRRAVRISSREALAVLSSAVVGGGRADVGEIVNLHVSDAYDDPQPEADLRAAAVSLGCDGQFVGLMTAAHTEYARVACEARAGVTVAAIVSVGLSNTTCAGVTPPIGGDVTSPVGGGVTGAIGGGVTAAIGGGVTAAIGGGDTGGVIQANAAAGAAAAQRGPSGAADRPLPGTINVILVIDAALSPAAMVNAVISATEAKTMMLAEWHVLTPEGEPASGTSTDAVVVACTGRGAGHDYAGPATAVGWLIGRTVRAAIAQICSDKIARDGGRRSGW